METRANHVLIGTFVVGIVLAGLGFVMWVASQGMGQESVSYAIVFEGPVTGLSTGGDVRYNGVKVGQVTKIRLNPKNPNAVGVIVQVDEDTPIHTDSVATVEIMGLTGIAFVQIAGGSPDAPMLRTASTEDVPLIPSRPSPIQQLVSGAPDLLGNATLLVQNLNTLLSPDNREAVSAVLQNAETVSDALVARQPELNMVVANVNAMSADLSLAAQNLRETSARLAALTRTAEETLSGVDQVVRNDLSPALGETREAVVVHGALAKDLRGLVASTEAAVEQFRRDGLSEVTILARQTQELVNTLDRLAERIERNPRGFLFGQTAREYRPE